MSRSKIPNRPLNKIAVSLSGGGYRAAAFHLGALSYLNRIQYEGTSLLERVKMISTVSGGTITGIVYALRKQRGESFEQIYDFLMGKLTKLDLLEAGLGRLSPEGNWANSFKHKNLINSFALLYDQHFTEGACFSVFEKMNSHLEAVVFNSTEFKNGIDFRFRNKGTGFFGNKLIQIDEDLGSEVKLSDAMASSSCFTGGFEPMMWPQDFLHEQANKLLEAQADLEPVGLMDGGIYDNQGIESILNYKKNDGLPYFDLVIVSDVTSPYMDSYKPTAEHPKKGIEHWTLSGAKKKIVKINRTVSLILLFLILFIFLLPFAWGYHSSLSTGILVGLGIGFVILLVAKEWMWKQAKFWLNKGVQKILGLIPPFYVPKLAKLKIEELSIHRIQPLLLDRIRSLGTLFLDVFLKIVRRLNYYKIYDNPEYDYRRISNLIRELTQTDYTQRWKRNAYNKAAHKYGTFSGNHENDIGAPIKKVVEEAASFGTTLWFTEKQQLENLLTKLVVSGQCTLCYNLLSYLESLVYEADNGFNELSQAEQNNLHDLLQKCRQDWEEFKKNPFFLT